MALNIRGGTGGHTGLASAGATGASAHPRQMNSSSPHNTQVSTISELLRPKQNPKTSSANLEFSAQSFARKELLGGSFELDVQSSRHAEETPEDMQKKDPLATQVWKLYSKQKGSLPNAERMENLTWRMMALTLRRERYELFSVFGSLFCCRGRVLWVIYHPS